ncbi:MAG: hypothetical protein P8Z74_00880 [Acidobacteriota bacterium]
MTPLDALLKEARQKIQRERLLRGTAIVLGYFLAAFLLSTYFLASNNFSESTVFWCRICFGGGLLLAVWRFLLRPLFRRPSSIQVARFLEERYPRLEQRLSTAVEITGPGSRTHPDLRALIRRDAVRQAQLTPQPRFYWPRIAGAATVSVFAILLTSTLLLVTGPLEFRFGLERLLGDWFDRTEQPLYRIDVTPGTTTVAERADVQIRALPMGFEPSEVHIFALYPGNPQWESTRMVAQPGASDFSFLFFDVREAFQYYVEADGIRSPEFRVGVSSIPRVTRSRITLHFPSYTGLSDAVLDNETQIRAVEGTKVEMTVETDRPAAAGLLKFENSDDIKLEPSGAKTFRASFEITRDDYFRVHLTNSEQITSPASDEYGIEAYKDQPPVLSFTYPGRDRPVTNIEEVFSEVKAEDDYGLRKLELHYSVNGGEDQTVPLGLTPGAKQATDSHTFYLEDYSLQPGDYISYFARARDAVSSSTTDIFFLEVEPFDRIIRQSQMSQSGGQQQQQGLQLSRREKQIVVATFSLVEDDHPDPKEMAEDSQTLALVQQRLQAEAQTMVERIERRGMSNADPRFGKLVENMKQAIDHMTPAHLSLNRTDPREALPEEQKALQYLMRAEKIFNEVQVSLSNGSGSANNLSPEDLADLVDLELDRTKNQYETLQRNRQEQRDEQIDEALEKLKELARRQQQQAERQRRQAMSGGGGGQASQQEMIDEMEKLARELARLSRNRSDQQLSRISRELSRAARDLRQSASSGQSSQESQRLAQQAAERLRQAQEALSQQRQSQARQDLQDLQQASNQLAESQKEVVRELGSIKQPAAGTDPSFDFYNQIRELYSKKQGLQRDLQELEGKLHQSAKRLEKDEPGAARRLKDAGLDIRDQRIPDKMREGSELMAGGLLGFARRREQDVQQDLEKLAKKIQDARNALGTEPQQSEDRLRQALTQAGSLVEQLESLRQRLQGKEEPGRQPSSQEPSQAARSQQQEGQQPGNRQGDRPGGQSAQNRDRQNPGQAAEGAGGQQGIAPQIGGVAGGFSTQGIDPGNARREWGQRLREAEELRNLLQGQGADPELAREATRLLQQMQQFDLSRVLDDPAEVQALKAGVIDGVHELELRISRALEDNPHGFQRPASDDEVPPDFRERVDDYYRRLAAEREQ